MTVTLVSDNSVPSSLVCGLVPAPSPPAIMHRPNCRCGPWRKGRRLPAHLLRIAVGGEVDAWESGRTVRHWRDRVRPTAVGVPVGRRRRAAGLRREELAGLAGISVDYLTRLEQGRATSPSVQVVEALARALRVPDAERDLLFRLAGHVTPGLDVVSSRITPSVQRLLDRLAIAPVAVFDATWTLLIANAPYDALMGPTTGWRGKRAKQRLAQPCWSGYSRRPQPRGASRIRGSIGCRPALDLRPISGRSAV